MEAQTFNLTLNIEPIPAARPRVSRWGTYYPESYKNFLKEAPLSIPPGFKVPEGLYKVSIKFFCKKPKKVTLRTPKGDIDNYAKGVLDVLTHSKVWDDDKGVYALFAEKTYDDNPRIEIEICVI